MLNGFADEVAAWIRAGESIKRRLAVAGSRLVSSLVKTRSYRELARESGYSVVFLNRVANGHDVISPGAFVRLSKIQG